MHTIVTNTSGTRTLQVSDTHLETIESYHLFDNLVDSNGIVDETVVDKLKLNIRSLLSADGGADKQLLDLCFDVIYHNNMKALGLSRLIDLYKSWSAQRTATVDETTTSPEE